MRTLCFTVDLDRDVNEAAYGSAAAISLDRGAGTAPRFDSCRKGGEALSALLDELGVKATFFAEATAAARVHAADFVSGHEVGLHGLDHEDFSGTRSGVLMDEGEIRGIVERAISMIRDEVGYQPKGFRSPYMLPDELMMGFIRDYGIVYDSSYYRYLEPSMRPYASEFGVTEVPVPKCTDASGKSVTGYLWPMHEGSRRPEEFLELADRMEDGVFVLATHTWHMAETRARGPMGDAEAAENLAAVRKVLEGFLDRGYRACTVSQALGLRAPARARERQRYIGQGQSFGGVVTMSTRLINGKEVSAEIYAELEGRIAALKSKGVTPGLAVVLVGEDPASQVYVRMKGRKCEELGMRSFTVALPAETTEAELLAKVAELNADPAVHGFLVQLPLPAHIDEAKVVEAIDPAKDVDGFHPQNVGRMLIGEPAFLPATPAGVQQMLVRSGIETSGKRVVVVGRSNIVGKPMAALLMQKGPGGDATVTVAHSRTADLPSVTRQADILIVAAGRPRFVTADMVKEGAVVIDVGTNRIPDPTHPKGSRLVGDVDFDSVAGKASAITPVPGGVGPMTICMLMANAVAAAERALGDRRWSDAEGVRGPRVLQGRLLPGVRGGGQVPDERLRA